VEVADPGGVVVSHAESLLAYQKVFSVAPPVEEAI
jgi:hypothetical protein